MKHNLTSSYLLSFDFDNDRKKMLDFISKNGGKDNFILKSFREGGLGKIYEKDGLIKAIQESSLEYLNSYILTHKIDSPEYPSISFNGKDVKFFEKTNTEFGFFSGYVFDYDSNNQLQTKYKMCEGCLVRTKISHMIKGGISFGRAFLDNIVLEE